MKNIYYYIGFYLEKFPMHLFEDAETFLPVRVVGLTNKGNQIYERLKAPFVLSDTSDYVMVVNPTNEILTILVLLGLKFHKLEGSANTDQLDNIIEYDLNSNFTIELDVYAS